jgi:hypothetical protein
MKTVPSNMVTVNKSGTQGSKQQTIIINKPGLRMPSGGQYIVMTTSTSVRPVQTLSTSQGQNEKSTGKIN